MNRPLNHPDVHFPPPVLYVLMMGLGYGLQRFIPLPELLLPYHGGLGIVSIAIGFFIIIWSVVEFSHHKTTILPHKASSAIIRSGPFKYSRNPIYVSFSIIQLGVAITLANIWITLLLVPVILIMKTFVIKREENFLAQEFGQAYTDYQKQVRRWV